MFFKIEPSSKYYFLVSHQIKRNKDQENGSILLKGNPEAPDSGSGFSLSLLFFLFFFPQFMNRKIIKENTFYKFAAQFILFYLSLGESFSQNNYTLLFGIFLLENELLQ